VAVALDAALVRTGTDVIFTLDEHGGVHEELGDVYESIAEAFGEKDLGPRKFFSVKFFKAFS
jgi:hypothetical protein